MQRHLKTVINSRIDLDLVNAAIQSAHMLIATLEGIKQLDKLEATGCLVDSDDLKAVDRLTEKLGQRSMSLASTVQCMTDDIEKATRQKAWPS